MFNLNYYKKIDRIKAEINLLELCMRRTNIEEAKIYKCLAELYKEKLLEANKND